MKAIKHFLFIIILGISFFSFSQNKIDLLILNKDYNEALLQIETQLNTNPSAQLYFKKGLIYKSLQNYQEALNSFSSALQIEPDNVEIIGEMADGLSILGNNIDAVNFYNKALELEPDNLTLSGKLGRVLINQKKLKDAYNIFSGIYAKDSTNVYWNKQLAYCAFRVGKKKEAALLYEMVLESNPRDYGTYLNLIHTYNWKKEGSKIMVLIGKGLSEFPYDAELILERANYFFRSKRYGPAMLSFEKYLKIDDTPPLEILMNYGISTYFAKFEEDALVIFNDLFRATPNDPIVQYYISLCNRKLKNFEEAEKMMQWAIDASTPEYVGDMYHHLGQIYGQQRKFNESIGALQKAHELNPTKYEILFEIATTYEEFNSNKTLALNYYRLYLTDANESAKNVNYALERITKIKEDMFFEE
ncbi:MAG: tetratricopeptide repeat protein [Draconibacterium sp.]|nr:tetratricopeptide repeat protein [Draconibacterium sp.]